MRRKEAVPGAMLPVMIWFRRRRAPPPNATLAQRLEALEEGSTLLCRGRAVERCGRGLVVHDSRTRRRIFCPDTRSALRHLRW